MVAVFYLMSYLGSLRYVSPLQVRPEKGQTVCSEVSFAYLMSLSPWVSKLWTGVQSCPEAAQRSLNCLSVCLAASSLGSEPMRGSPLCVFSSTVCVVLYLCPVSWDTGIYLWYRRHQQKPLERGSLKLGRSASWELIFSLIPGQPHYLDFSNLAPTSEPILLLCDSAPLARACSVLCLELVIPHHGMPRSTTDFL